jgi:hypothetical protein
MIFAIGAEVLFRARMPSAAACVILGALTSSRINFDLDQTESRARHLYLTRLKDQMSLLS